MRVTSTIFTILLLLSIGLTTLHAEKENRIEEADAVVEKFQQGQKLTKNEMRILTNIVSAKNNTYFPEIIKAYKKAKFPNDDSGNPAFGYSPVVEQFENAWAKRVQLIAKDEIKQAKFGKAGAPGNIYVEQVEAGDLPGTSEDATGADVIQGVLTVNGDVDMFQIYIEDLTALQIDVTINTTVGDTQIFLFDSDGRTVADNDDGGGGFGLRSQIESFDIPGGYEPGVYYIAISSFNNDPLNNVGGDIDGSAGSLLDHWDPTRGGSNGFYEMSLSGIGTGVTLPAPKLSQWVMQEDGQFRLQFPNGTYQVRANTSFVTPRFVGNYLYITVAANWHGNALITVTSGGQQKTYQLTVVPVNDPPNITPVASQTIQANNQLELALSGSDADYDRLTYSAFTQDPNIELLVVGNKLYITPAPDYSTPEGSPALIAVTVRDPYGGQDTWGFNLTIESNTEVVSQVVSGYIHYNQIKDNVSDLRARLVGEDDRTYETDLAEDGAFEFAAVANGYYRLELVREEDAKAVTSADALLALRNSVDAAAYPLDELQTMAADVDGSESVTAGDALNILNKVVGRANNFGRPEWILAKDEIGVGARNVSFYTHTIVSGDADNSLLKGGLDKRAVLSITEGEVSLTKENTVSVPVYARNLANLAAFDLAINFDESRFEFAGVKGGLAVISNVVKDQVRLAWLNMEAEGLNVNDEAPLFELEFRAKGDVERNYQYALEVAEGEFVNANGDKIDARIEMPLVSNAVPEAFALEQNYPNPFNPSTKIGYSLPYNSQVTLTIYDITGQVINEIVNTQINAGSHEATWNGRNQFGQQVSSGIYFYTLKASSLETGENFVKTAKMMLLK